MTLDDVAGNRKTIETFREIVYSHYSLMRDGREMPWRANPNPYYVLVSEFMLQQTQVSRVIDKFLLFVRRLPNVAALARADFRTVLELWQGLGYNRRAKFLHECAKEIVTTHGGKIPADNVTLKTLPGVGAYTSGAIAAFAFDTVVSFIDTNIRRVYIHHFFSDTSEAIDDGSICELNDLCMQEQSPRKWYGSLMDWGAHLGQNLHSNPNKKSRHYTKQSRFEGSNRQVRGAILKCLTQMNKVSYSSLLTQRFNKSEEEFKTILETLEEEGFLVQENGVYSIRAE